MNFKSLLALILIGLLLFGSYYLFSMEEETQEETKTTQNTFEELLARLHAQNTVEAEQETDEAVITDEPVTEPSQEITDSFIDESNVENNDQQVDNLSEQQPQEEN